MSAKQRRGDKAVSDWTWREGALLERLDRHMPIALAAEFSGLSLAAAKVIAARARRIGRI